MHAFLKKEWESWKKAINKYPSHEHWFCGHVKNEIGKFFRKSGAERRRDHKHMENFYHQAMYDLIHGTSEHAHKRSALNHLKAKIVRLDTHYKSIMLDTGERVKYADEEPSLFHML
jgi:hypothetical protein